MEGERRTILLDPDWPATHPLARIIRGVAAGAT
jgi:hypothetical protein